MKITSRLTNDEYAALSTEYSLVPPELSGKPGFLTIKREQSLIAELLPPDYARIITTKAKAMSMLPSEIIKQAIKAHLS